MQGLLCNNKPFADHPLPCNLPPDASAYKPITSKLIKAAKCGPPITAFTNAEDESMPLPDEIDSSFPIAAVIPSEAVLYLGKHILLIRRGRSSFSQTWKFLWSAKAWTLNNSFFSLSCLLDTSAHLNCARS